MKTRVYLRIGKNKHGRSFVRASKEPRYDALPDNKYDPKIPTVLIALDLDIPDKDFSASKTLLELKINNAQPAALVSESKLSEQEKLDREQSIRDNFENMERGGS